MLNLNVYLVIELNEFDDNSVEMFEGSYDECVVYIKNRSKFVFDNDDGCDVENLKCDSDGWYNDLEYFWSIESKLIN